MSDLHEPRPIHEGQPHGPTYRSRSRSGLGLGALLVAATALWACTGAIEDADGVEGDEQDELDLRAFDLVPDPDLVLRMTFDDPGALGFDEVIKDRSEDYDCIPADMTAVDDGRRAAGFDGQSSACSFPVPNGDFVDGADAVSMSMWVRPRSVDGILYRQQNGPSAGYQIEGDGGKLRVGGRAKSDDPFGWIELDYPFELDTWHHVVGVLDYGANRISLYLDGALALSQDGVLASGPTFQFTPGSAEMIGAYVPGGFGHFDGRIDDVRVYRRALGASDAQAIYLATLGGEASAPTVHLEFEDGDLGLNSGVGGNCTATGLSAGFGNVSAVYDGHSVCSFPSSTGLLSADWGSATVSAWINPADLDQGTIYRQEVEVQTAGYQMTFWEGALTFGGRSTVFDPWQSVSHPWPHAPSSGWHHVAGIIDYEQGELRLYVDGMLEASSEVSFAHRSLQPSPAVAGPLTGMRLLDGTRAYQGELDELRVYTRSFADDEVSELF